MKLTLTDLFFNNSEDNGRYLHFDSNDVLFSFSFGYFNKSSLPESANVSYSNGDLILNTNNPEANVNFILTTNN